jgi:hypothetical protein
MRRWCGVFRALFVELADADSDGEWHGRALEICPLIARQGRQCEPYSLTMVLLVAEEQR